ncbi:MAG: tetratricopeptide repeat protein [Ignavibacteriae bacterium]|nr:tetratricopeptide repeat protein [Ignavibacteriota bacterium]
MLADQKRFAEAKNILKLLIEKNPTISDFHRVYGQIFEVEGNYETARDNIAEALRWDPNNNYALIMMGNIYARHFNDVDTATRFYNKSLALNPNDYISLNNIGGNLANLEKYEDAERYFRLALTINQSYPNTYYGLALALRHKGELLEAFNYVTVAMISSFEKDENLYNASSGLAGELSYDYIQKSNNKEVIDKYVSKLKYETEKDIRIEESKEIPTIASTQYAEVHKRDYHLVRYKPGTPAYQHFVLHELAHIDFANKASKAGRNKVFLTNDEHREKFIRNCEGFVSGLNKAGHTDTEISNFMVSLFNGLVAQIYNAPVDLLIEHYLYENFPENRPYQFYALIYMNNSYLKGYPDRDIKKFTPKIAYEGNIIMNIAGAYQLFDLYGLDYYSKYPEYKVFKGISRNIYNMYLNYLKGTKPGDEYDLIEKWGKQLKLSSYFKLVDEKDYLTDSNDILDEISKDPFNLEREKRENAIERVSFKDNPMESMAVTMYCLDALKTYEGKDESFVKEVTFEIAMLGTYGLNPYDNEKQYSLKTIPDKKFTALHLLSFEYVGFQKIDPSMDTHLDFQSEYQNAIQMFKTDE